MNRRLIGILISLALGVIGTFVIISYVRGAESRALEGEETVQVLVVDRFIEQGTAAERLTGMTRIEQVPVKVQAAGSIDSLDQLAGRVAAVDLLPGEQLNSSRFVAPEVLQAQEEARQVEVPPDLLEVTVALAPERAVGGQLRPGDTVAVISSFEPFNLDVIEPSELGADPGTEVALDVAASKTPNTSHIILHKVLVTSVQEERRQVSSSSSASEDDPTTPQKYEHDSAPQGQLLVTLAVDAPSVERIVFTAEHGFLWLAVDPEEAPTAGTTIQTRGTIYR